MASVRLAALGVLGVVRLGFVGSAVYQQLPQTLPGFIARHPGVTLELSEGVTVTLLQAMKAGRMDVGVIRLPADDVAGFRITEVEKTTLSQFCREAIPWQAARPLS